MNQELPPVVCGPELCDTGLQHWRRSRRKGGVRAKEGEVCVAGTGLLVQGVTWAMVFL